MRTTFYWLLEIKRENKVPLYIAPFMGGFAITSYPTKACCFKTAKYASGYLEDLKKKHPEFLNYDKIEILEHGFEHNPMAGL